MVATTHGDRRLFRHTLLRSVMLTKEVVDLLKEANEKNICSTLLGHFHLGLHELNIEMADAKASGRVNDYSIGVRHSVVRLIGFWMPTTWEI